MILGWIAALAAEPPVIAHQEWRRADVNDLVADDPASIRALGRARDLHALKHLVGEDRETWFALTLTPGSAPRLRELLGSTPQGQEYDARWYAIEGLGRQGTRADVGRVKAELKKGWPYDEAAARALLRMHRREIDVGAVQSLVKRWTDPRTEIAAAQAAARILPKGSVPFDFRQGMTSSARAAWLRVGATRAEELRWGLWDQPGVQLEALAAIARLELRELGPDVGVLFTATHPSIREAAYATAGTLGMKEGLEARLQEVTGVAEQAAIHGALKRGLPPAEDVHPLIASVWVQQLDDPKALLELLRPEVHPMVHTAAVSRLLELEPPRETVLLLLQNRDPAVRDAAISALHTADPATVDEMIFSLRVENHVGVLGSGLAKLLEWKQAGSRHVKPTRFLQSTLKRGMSSDSTHVIVTSKKLAAALGLELLPPPPATDQRELILPDGTVTTTTGNLPTVAEVMLTTGALVTTSRGAFDLELSPRDAPLAVYNFAALARTHFFDGLPWHRVIPGFVAQGGCPRGDGWGGPGWTIVDEVSDRPFVDGALGMARSDRDTGGSQFFLMTGQARFLDGDYTWFGRVREGLDVVKALGPDDHIVSVKIY